ncbi:MAG TPA: S1/P1 nuclease [Bryobacteraceae bacterium]|nr:S1/P1 nuclease [Bryobacteraceae bacterium]
MRRFFPIVLSYCVLTPFCAFGWWETGHQTVARIAAAHLTPAARTRMARILNVSDTPEAVADALAKASTWADDTKNETKTGEWHYIDLALQDHKTDIPLRCKADNCAPVRIGLFAAQLANPPIEARWSQLDSLRYLIHFVGDVHQPLHAISDADLGGNCERLDPPVDTAKNLHSLWDGGIIRAMDVDDKALAASLEQEIQGFDSARQAELVRGDQNDWAWESHEVAIQDVYYKLHIPVEAPMFPANCSEAPAEITEFKVPVDTLYVDSMKPVVREQLIKGGLRLAKMLNESL